MPTTPRAPARSFAEFYVDYLAGHRNPTCRKLHFFGCLGALFCLAKLATTAHPIWLPAGLLWGYGLSWIGHYAFEKNRPMSFRHPWYALAGDWVMFKDILVGRIPF